MGAALWALIAVTVVALVGLILIGIERATVWEYVYKRREYVYKRHRYWAHVGLVAGALTFVFLVGVLLWR